MRCSIFARKSGGKKAPEKKKNAYAWRPLGQSKAFNKFRMYVWISMNGVIADSFELVEMILYYTKDKFINTPLIEFYMYLKRRLDAKYICTWSHCDHTAEFECMWCVCVSVMV